MKKLIDIPEEAIEIQLKKNWLGIGLAFDGGFTISGGPQTLIVKEIYPNTAASQCELIQIHDQIIGINYFATEHLTHLQTLKYIQGLEDNLITLHILPNSKSKQKRSNLNSPRVSSNRLTTQNEISIDVKIDNSQTDQLLSVDDGDDNISMDIINQVVQKELNKKPAKDKKKITGECNPKNCCISRNIKEAQLLLDNK